MGSVEFADGEAADIYFDARQMDDGRIVVGCLAKGGTRLSREATRIHGVTTDYDTIALDGRNETLLNGAMGGTLPHMHYAFRTMRLTHGPSHLPARHFSATFANLIIDPFNIMIPPPAMQVTFGDYCLEIAPVDGYVQAWERLQAYGGVLPTVTITVSRTDDRLIDAGEITPLLFELCNPLSLACSTRIAWLRYVASWPKDDGTRRPLHTEHTSSLSQPYTNDGVMRGLTSDIAALLPAWAVRAPSPISTEALGIRIAHYLDACARHNFAETSALSAAALLDAISNEYATATSFKGTLRKRLDHLLEDLQIECDFVDAAVQTRNELAHQGRFLTENHGLENTQLLWLAYAILVRLVDTTLPLPEP